MPKLSSLTVDRFLDKLASAEPVPGGGSAAALVAAQAAALGEMVAGLNIKRAHKLGTSDAFLKKIHVPLSIIRKKLTALMEKDASIFSALSRYKKEDRSKPSYQAALKKAAMVPFDICEMVEKGLQLAALEKSLTSTWLYSDLVECAVLFEAAFYSARLNVEINLTTMTDRKLASELKARLEVLAKKISNLRHEIGDKK